LDHGALLVQQVQLEDLLVRQVRSDQLVLQGLPELQEELELQDHLVLQELPVQLELPVQPDLLDQEVEVLDLKVTQVQQVLLDRKVILELRVQ
jgi:hypothetical protein